MGEADDGGRLLRHRGGARRLERENLDSLLRQLAVQRVTVEPRALATRGRPLLLGAEVVDKPEGYVAHPRAACDRHGQREDADAAFGVQRSVDGIDDDVDTSRPYDADILR